MAALSSKMKQSYRKQGYLIIRGNEVRWIKDRLKNDLKVMALEIMKRSPAGVSLVSRLKNKSFQEIFDACIAHEKKNEISRSFYELFPVSFSVMELLGHPFFTGISRSLDLAYPIPSTMPILRIDRPRESRYLTPAHQDYWYSFLSFNSLTYWFPMFPITEKMGHLLVVPGSHVNGNLPIRQWSDENPFALRNEIELKKYVPVDLAENEVLVFSQYLIHRSGENRSDRARLTIQVRHNDLRTLDKLTTSFTPKHSVYTALAQKEWLDKSWRGEISRE